MISIEELRSFCSPSKGAGESMPFDDKALVFSVKGKMLCTTDVNIYEFVNLKCDPDKVIQLREQYNEVIEGCCMNRKHWNSVKTKGKITDKQLQEWIKDSYDLVVLALLEKIQKGLSDE